MTHRRAIEHSIEVAGHVLGRCPIAAEGDQLVVTFTVSGPDASPRFAKQHVVLFRLGDTEKLNSRGGYGGYEDDGTAFFDWRFNWPGGDGVHVLYFEGRDRIVGREWVPVSGS